MTVIVDRDFESDGVAVGERAGVSADLRVDAGYLLYMAPAAMLMRYTFCPVASDRTTRPVPSATVSTALTA